MCVVQNSGSKRMGGSNRAHLWVSMQGAAVGGGSRYEVLFKVIEKAQVQGAGLHHSTASNCWGTYFAKSANDATLPGRGRCMGLATGAQAKTREQPSQVLGFLPQALFVHDPK
eukprot:scaffold154291_cov19-Tisochrysis_lutea.AAC.2